MVEATRTRCKAEGIESCVVEGSVHAIASEPPFNVVVSTLVLHFIPKAARVDWLRAVRALIRPGGALVLTAITDSEAPGVAPHWASLRKDYAVRRGMSPEALARRKAPTASQVEEVREDELGAQLAEAGFAPAIPLYQLLAVRSWRVTAPCA